jgi:hypothetical protein
MSDDAIELLSKLKVDERCPAMVPVQIGSARDAQPVWQPWRGNPTMSRYEARQCRFAAGHRGPHEASKEEP